VRARASGDEVRAGGECDDTICRVTLRGKSTVRARSTGFWSDFARDLGVKKTQIAVEADTSTQVERNVDVRSFEKRFGRPTSPRSRAAAAVCQKLENRTRRVRILPARVPKERSTMLARAASSGGGTRDSPSGRRPSRIKMITPEEDKELQVRAVPSAMRPTKEC
jgi:hypothetical protein